MYIFTSELNMFIHVDQSFYTWKHTSRLRLKVSGPDVSILLSIPPELHLDCFLRPMKVRLQ